MIIKLSNGYFIEIDNFNHTLKQVYTFTTKEGEVKEAEKVLGYFSSLDNALERYLKHSQCDFMADASVSLDEYLKLMHQAIDEAIHTFKKAMGEIEE